eukprot:12584939-Alexandrium_andersonii.AAC.1
MSSKHLYQAGPPIRRRSPVLSSLRSRISLVVRVGSKRLRAWSPPRREVLGSVGSVSVTVGSVD